MFQLPVQEIGVQGVQERIFQVQYRRSRSISMFWIMKASIRDEELLILGTED